METTTQSRILSVRELMPKGYLRILEKRTKATRSQICKVVKKENTASDIWPSVVQLAEENKVQMQQEQERLIRLKTMS